MRKIIFIILIVNIQFSFSQNSESQQKDYKYQYNDFISFKIKKMKEHKKGGFGYVPLRGFTSFKFYLTFKNFSDSEQTADLDSIFLANPLTKKRYKLKWFNTSGIGSKIKTTFKLKPNKKKTFIVFYIFENKQKPYFLIKDRLLNINHND